jgi:hypothetical protein
MAERPWEIKIHTHPLSLVEDPDRIRGVQRGELIHRALCYLDQWQGEEAIERAILRAFAFHGVDRGRWDIAKDFLGPLLAALSLAEARPWFAPGVKNLREAEVMDAHGELLRIDRLIIGGRKLQVIDFKVGRREQGHRDQVALYQGIVEAIFRLPTEGYLLYIDEPAVVAVP